MGLGMALFGKAPDALALAGCGLILMAGVALPFLAVRRGMTDHDAGP